MSNMDMSVENPDDIDMKLTVTMSLGQWKKLRNQLKHEWPSSDIGSKIIDMIYQANKHFYPNEDVKKVPTCRPGAL